MNKIKGLTENRKKVLGAFAAGRANYNYVTGWFHGLSGGLIQAQATSHWLVDQDLVEITDEVDMDAHKTRTYLCVLTEKGKEALA